MRAEMQRSITAQHDGVKGQRLEGSVEGRAGFR
jgi:hypothetical protein